MSLYVSLSIHLSICLSRCNFQHYCISEYVSFFKLRRISYNKRIIKAKINISITESDY